MDKRNQLVNELVTLIGKENKVSLKSDTSIKINSKTYTARQYYTHFLKYKDDFMVRLTNDSKLELIDIISKDRVELLIDDVFAKVVDILKEKIRKEAQQATDKEIELGTYDYRSHFKVVDVKTDEEILFNRKSALPTDLNVDTWDKWLSTRQKEEREIYHQSTVFGLIDYDPFDTRMVKQVIVGDQSISEFNAHAFPDWRKEEIQNPQLPNEFKDFMKYFLPDKESRGYVLSWLYHMIVDRNETHLLLHGKRGIGKNTVVEVASRLVGDLNYKLVDPKFWDDRFNGELKYKRLCYFDEHEITEQNITQLKAYANSYISIQEKNVKVERNYKNFASFIIANNNPQGNFLCTDDRRFSVPILTEKRMDHEFSREWINELYDKIKRDDGFIGNIGWWLLKNGEGLGFNNMQAFKSDLFYELVENNLKEWQRKLVDIIKSGEYSEIPVAELGIILDLNTPPGHSKLARFLDNHTDREGHFYASIRRLKGKGRTIVPKPKYAPKEEENEEFEEDDSLNMDDF